MRQATLVLLLSHVLILPACSGNKADELYETAQFEERQHNQAHAKQLYEEIIRDHPDTEIAKKAKERLAQLGQSK